MTYHRNAHDEDMRLRCPGCRKQFETREGVANHVRSTLHGEWITDFSVPGLEAKPASAVAKPDAQNGDA